MNVEDLSREIDRVSGMLASLDFEGVYTGNLQAKCSNARTPLFKKKAQTGGRPKDVRKMYR
jgi:hypothetical protein